MSLVVALVPARDEEPRIEATVRALAGVRGIDEVIVIDDASTDGTARVASAAGARVLKASRRRGKGGALEEGLARTPHASVYVLADGDLGDGAAGLGDVLAPVLDGRADLAIGVLPFRGGGLGTVKRFAARAIRRICGFEPAQPLSGQRAATREALAACRPFAAGFGVETAMTIDAVRAGFRVVEIPASIEHTPTDRSLSGFAHRGRQGAEILRAVFPRALGLR